MSFSQTLTDVVNGTRKLEDFANIIVSSSIEDVLLRVSRDYGLDFTKLVNDYKDDVLDKHALLLGSGGTKCKGFTTTNKPCGRKAVCRGYCRGHSAQAATNQNLDNKAVNYVTSSSKKGADDVLLHALEKLGANFVTENQMISKTDTFNVC